MLTDFTSTLIKVLDKEMEAMYNYRLEQVKNGNDQVKKH